MTLTVGVAVDKVARGIALVGPRISHYAGRGVLIAVRRMLDQILFRQLEALGLASSGLLHRSALLTVTRGAIHDRL